MEHCTYADISGCHERDFMRNAERGNREDCWGWKGMVDRHGYSSSKAEGSRTSGHRIGYILLRGDIPPGMVLDHLCRNRLCVNPWHLEIVTNQENLRRRGRSGMCGTGRHRLTPENVYIPPDGRRCCRECQREATQRYRAKLRGAKVDEESVKV